MAKHAAVNRYLAINGTAISDHCSDIEIADVADKIEVSSFDGSGYKSYVPGLKDPTVTVTLFADFSAASVHAMLQPLYQTGGTFSVEIRDDAGARSATNPAALMTGKLYGYSPITGAIGAAAEFTAEIGNAGTSGITWATS